MPPRRELCRNFQRGSCQYGERCKFLHVTQQQAKPNPFGFGAQTGMQFQNQNSQLQKPNPFGFGVQSNSQPRGNDFASRPHQFKPGENKWTRFSPINAGISQAPRQSDNQPSAAPNHQCTDPESCKSQIIEDFENERPLWNLTCYGHSKYGPCDIVGDISFEELRAYAYDDAKRGLSLQSIVERERNLLNSKLREFENLRHNPYAVPPNATLADQKHFPVLTQNNMPPSVSSFGQLGTSFNVRPVASSNSFAQGSLFQASSQVSDVTPKNNFSFGGSGTVGSQFPVQPFGSSFATSTLSVGSVGMKGEQNPFPVSQTTPNLASSHSAMVLNGPNPPFSTSQLSSGLKLASNESPVILNDPDSAPTVVTDMAAMGSVLGSSSVVDKSVWLKERWTRGEIPEEPPPAEFIF